MSSETGVRRMEIYVRKLSVVIPVLTAETAGARDAADLVQAGPVEIIGEFRTGFQLAPLDPAVAFVDLFGAVKGRRGGKRVPREGPSFLSRNRARCRRASAPGWP